GFKRAFVAIFDSNITTIITAVVLFILGSGPIKGFGLTLGLGVLLSFLTAITISRNLLIGVSAFGFSKNKWLYGVSDGGMKNAKV
ncbi:MAG: protein translocase subunit SecD, partial [Clostridia bacterium]|nr:protein translocase subunit SecD [Clostridia bacterium]